MSAAPSSPHIIQQLTFKCICLSCGFHSSPYLAQCPIAHFQRLLMLDGHVKSVMQSTMHGQWASHKPPIGNPHQLRKWLAKLFLLPFAQCPLPTSANERLAVSTQSGLLSQRPMCITSIALSA